MSLLRPRSSRRRSPCLRSLVLHSLLVVFSTRLSYPLFSYYREFLFFDLWFQDYFPYSGGVSACWIREECVPHQVCFHVRPYRSPFVPDSSQRRLCRWSRIRLLHGHSVRGVLHLALQGARRWLCSLRICRRHELLHERTINNSFISSCN